MKLTNTTSQIPTVGEEWIAFYGVLRPSYSIHAGTHAVLEHYREENDIRTLLYCCTVRTSHCGLRFTAFKQVRSI